MTAVIGDVASYFGCTLGIKDSVTAVAFVALGTSIPGELSEPSSEIFSGREGEEGGSLLIFFFFFVSTRIFTNFPRDEIRTSEIRLPSHCN